MQVTIYLDVVFFINFIADLFILVMTGIILKQKMKIVRLMAGASFGAAMLLPFLMYPSCLQGITGFVMFTIISMGTVAISYGRKNGSLFRKWLVLTVFLFLLGGIMNCLRCLTGMTAIRISAWLLLFLGSGIGFFFLIFFMKKNMQREKTLYLMKIRQGEKQVVDYVYLDTGNMLWDPLFCKPVIVLGEKLATSFMTEEEKEIVEIYKKKGQLQYEKVLVCKSQKNVCFHEIVCQSVGNPSGKLLCFLAEEISIHGLEKTLRRQPVAIAPSILFEGKAYQGLLYKECI